MATASPALRRILDAFLEHYDSQDDAGLAIGISGSRLGRIRKGEHAPEVLTCLRLAHVGGFRPGDVLRAAGKTEVADLLDVLYGRVAVPLPNRRDRELLKRRAALTPELQKALEALLGALTRP